MDETLDDDRPAPFRPDDLIGVFLLALFETIAVGALTVTSWMLSGWYLGDAALAQMTTWDWWHIALERIAWWSAIGGLAAMIAFYLNRFVARSLGNPNSRVPIVSALLFFSAISIASIIGALQFAVKKPM